MRQKGVGTCFIKRCQHKAIRERIPVKAGTFVAEVPLCSTHAYGFDPRKRTGLTIWSKRDGLDDAGQMAEAILTALGWDHPEGWDRHLEIIGDELRLGWGAHAFPGKIKVKP